MRAIGFASTRPKVPNYDLEGKPIPENQHTNRRISIRVYPMSINEQAKFNIKVDLKSMLKDVTENSDQGKSIEAGDTAVKIDLTR